MKERSVKTRTDCLALLKELVIVLPGALTNHVGTLIPGIQFSLRYYYYTESSVGLSTHMYMKLNYIFLFLNYSITYNF